MSKVGLVGWRAAVAARAVMELMVAEMAMGCQVTAATVEEAMVMAGMVGVEWEAAE